MDHYYDSVAENDFVRVRLRSTLSSMLAFAKRTPDQLISLDEAREILKPTGESFQGTKTIEIAKIVGSEGRYSDFTRRFLPLRDSTAYRWKRVHVARQRDISLPAIMVYELGGYYFIRDGNHRVSVAVQAGVTFIDAQVTSLGTEVSLGEVNSVEDLKRAVLEYENSRFAESIGQLERARDITFSATGRFDDVLWHIACHRIAVKKASGELLDHTAATQSWYRTVYLPITQFIRDSRVLDSVPGRTEADLYVWLVRHWDEIIQPVGEVHRTNRRLRRRFLSQVR